MDAGRGAIIPEGEPARPPHRRPFWVTLLGRGLGAIGLIVVTLVMLRPQDLLVTKPVTPTPTPPAVMALATPSPVPTYAPSRLAPTPLAPVVFSQPCQAEPALPVFHRPVARCLIAQGTSGPGREERVYLMADDSTVMLTLRAPRAPRPTRFDQLPMPDGAIGTAVFTIVHVLGQDRHMGAVLLADRWVGADGPYEPNGPLPSPTWELLLALVAHTPVSHGDDLIAP